VLSGPTAAGVPLTPARARRGSPAQVPAPGTTEPEVPARPTSLVSRPEPGPLTSAPDRVADLRVLGEGAVAAPVPAQATVISTSPEPVGTDPTERWHAATRAVPLEAARPLPDTFRSLVRTVTGSRTTVTYTSGAATRAALAATGASAATSRGVLHLPDHPRTGSPASVALVAHELAHLRSAVVRPRFLLHDHITHADDDERSALDVGRAATSAVGGLPVAGAGRGVAEVARRAAAAAVADVLPSVGRTGGAHDA
jgi:hypothetical protein